MAGFVRYGLPHVVERLRRFASSAGLAADPCVYFHDRDALVPEPWLAGDPELAARVAGNAAGIARVELPFSAHRITVRVHARVFAPGLRAETTAKVALIPAIAGKSFFREVRVRRVLAPHIAGTGLTTPAIVKAAPAEGWFIEEHVAGHHALDEDLVRLISEARRLYEPTVRMRPVAGSQANRVLIARLKAYLAGIARPLASFPDQGWWPTALCHGDITASNVLCRDDGRLSLIDWEQARFAPLAVELGWLYGFHPAVRSPALRLLAALTAPRPSLTPIHQLALGTALALKRRERLREVTMRSDIQLRGRSEAEASVNFERGMEVGRKAIADLLG